MYAQHTRSLGFNPQYHLNWVVVASECNPSSQVAEAGESGVEGQSMHPQNLKSAKAT